MPPLYEYAVDSLTIFGLATVFAMLMCYAFEDRSAWWVLGFTVACGFGSVYGFLRGAWPFGVVEAVWSPCAAGGDGGRTPLLRVDAMGL
jgi:hypothetical protein